MVRMRAILRRSWLVAILAAAAHFGACGQEKKEPVGQDFFITDIGQHTCADATWIAAMPAPTFMNPWGVVGMRMLASEKQVGLQKWQFDFNEVIPLKQRYLDTMVDRRPLPTLRFKELQELGPDLPFYMLFCEAIEKTYFAHQDQFVNSAEENKNRHYAQLNATPDRYRGQVITAKGKLKVVREEDTPRLVTQRMKKDAPRHIYTGWITGPQKNLPPYTIVFLDLPVEVPQPSDKLDLDVTFQGYFLGMVSFPSGKEVKGKKQEMYSPYLVGKTFVVNPPEKIDVVVPPPVEKDETSNSYYIIIWTVTGIVSVALLVAVLNVWFGRGDRAVRSRLAEMRDRQQPFSLEPADETPAPEEGIKPADPPQ
jgi:hypothetical protein